MKYAGLLLPLLLLVSCASLPVGGPAEEPAARDEAEVLMEEGESLTLTQDLPAARDSFESALAQYAARDDRGGTVQALLAIGWNSWQAGDPAAAGVYYGHARDLASAGGDPVSIRDALNHQADLAWRMGDPVEAAELLNTGPESTGSARVDAARLRLLGSARDGLGETEEALGLLKRAWDTAVSGDELNEQAQSAYRLAVILSRQASFNEAADWAHRALEADAEAGYAPGIAADLRALAIISEKSGDPQAAEDFYRRAWLAWWGQGRMSDAEDARRALETLTGRSMRLP